MLQKVSLSQKMSSKSLVTHKGGPSKNEFEPKKSSKSLITDNGVLQKVSLNTKRSSESLIKEKNLPPQPKISGYATAYYSYYSIFAAHLFLKAAQRSYLGAHHCSWLRGNVADHTKSALSLEVFKSRLKAELFARSG